MKNILAPSLLLTILTTGSWAIDVGDKAPPLSIAEWIQGEPVDLKKDLGKKIYMVEFWATWCPPCKVSIPLLTELQTKYKKDLTIIGVTAADDRGNTPVAVKRFVKERGEKMNYHVAMDKNDATSKAYLPSTGMVGIPYAYLVGKDGAVIWHGSPLDPSLDEVLRKVVAGTFDVVAAKKGAELNAEVSKRFDALNTAAQMGQWSVVWDGLVGILKLDPANAEAMDLMMQIYVNETRDAKAYREWVGSHLAAHRGNALTMQRLAAVLTGNAELALRTPDLTIEAAKAAYEAARKDPASITIYALALYQVGAVDRAITLQEEAVAIAKGEEESKSAKDVLAYFRQCKELQTSIK